MKTKISALIITALMLLSMGAAQDTQTPENLPLDLQIRQWLGADISTASSTQATTGEIKDSSRAFDVTGGGNQINPGEGLEFTFKAQNQGSGDVCIAYASLVTEDPEAFGTYKAYGEDVIAFSSQQIATSCGETKDFSINFDAPGVEGDYTVNVMVSENNPNRQDSTAWKGFGQKDSFSVQEQLSSINAGINAPRDAEVAENIRLEAEGDGEGELEYDWDIDGRSASGDTAQAVFDETGRKNIELEITDEEGQTDTASTTIDIEANPPQAELKVETPGQKAKVGDRIVLSASNSMSGSFPIRSYNWKIDGRVKSGQEVTWSPQSTGTANIELEVTDSNRNSDTASTSVNVVQNFNKPNLKIKAPNTAEVGETLTLDASQSTAQAGIRSIKWNIQGQTSTGQQTNVKFETTGQKSVTVTAQDDKGQETQSTFSINVVEEKGILQTIIDWFTSFFTK